MENDMEAIEKYIASVDPALPFLESLNCTITVYKMTGTGKWKVKKHKWRIVNWWRKLIGMERMEEEIVYQWISE